MNTDLSRKIDKIFNKAIISNKIEEAVLFVQNTNGSYSYSNGYGGLDIDSPLLMASITKLFTTACILALQEQGKLSLDDKISKYFDNDILDGLHNYKGNDYSYELTLFDLLFQTSGLPDVYEEGKNSFKDRVIKEDFRYSFSDIVETTKKLCPHFKPRSIKRAYYADINFDMLGEILERIMNQPLNIIYQRFIFEPLKLQGTYLPESINDRVPNIYYKHKAIQRPQFIMSSGASGGCVSTAREIITFLKAFFDGEMFDISIFDKLSSYNKLQASMGPICYGSGYMRIPLGGLATLFMGKGELKGHSGSTGSFAFYYPVKDLFIAGNLNQMGNPALPIRLSMRIVI
ncbi:MAG: serine hydrolase [Eubacteriales bacterium]|nr:serine hydrolase [Eubacteriales bacterium]